MPHVTIYTSTGCVYCERLRQWLADRSIPYEERNVTINPTFFDELNAKGIFTSPVAIIGDTPVVGFRPNKMTELLGLTSPKE
jgi:thioredoxin reductase (NADPH)